MALLTCRRIGSHIFLGAGRATIRWHSLKTGAFYAEISIVSDDYAGHDTWRL
jgi:hypothetical protein